MKVLVAASLHGRAIEILKNAGLEVVYEENTDQEKLKELVKDVSAIIVRSTPKVTKEIIDAAPNLKVIARAGVGSDNIDVEYAKGRGIEIVNAPAASTRSVAELVIALIFNVARKVAFADRKMREGMWAKKQCMGFELEGKTLGVIGFGRIGYTVAKMAKGLGMRVIYYSRNRKTEAEKEIGAEYVDFETLLKESDFISPHVPLTPKTYHLIGERELKLMKPTAIFINTSRGAIVDSNALIRALQEGCIAGAGLDVFEEEPLPKDHPLTKLDNVVLPPHIGASTGEAQEKAGIEIAEKIIKVLNGVDKTQ